MNAAPQRKFVDMSGRESRAIIAEIKKQDFDSIMNAWLKAGRVEDDRIKQTSIGTVWGWEMQQRPVSAEFYEKMKAIIDDPSYSMDERGDMIGVLSLAATPEAAKLLVREATAPVDPEVKRMATSAIAVLGDNSHNEAIADLLNPLWKDSSDPLMIKSLAKAMGKIGAASSVELLFKDALAARGLNDARGNAAWDGLRAIFTENAVPPLVAVLEKNPPDSPANKLALDTLAQIGSAASKPVIKWLQTADSSAAPSAKAWVGKSQQLEAAQAALDPAVPFRSEANREALRAGLAAYRAGHKLEK